MSIYFVRRPRTAPGTVPHPSPQSLSDRYDHVRHLVKHSLLIGSPQSKVLLSLSRAAACGFVVLSHLKCVAVQDFPLRVCEVASEALAMEEFPVLERQQDLLFRGDLC